MKLRLMLVIRYAGLVIVIVLVSVIAYWVGQRSMLIRTIGGYYESRGDGDLLKQYGFPYRFLPAKIRRDHLTQRAEIDAVIFGYYRKETETTADGIVDTYFFDMGHCGVSSLLIMYDKQSKLQRFSECGSSIGLK